MDSVLEGNEGIVSTEQIKIVNGANETNPLISGQRLVVPLPCTCFNNGDSGATTVYMSYVMVKGENLGHIAGEYRTTVNDLESVNCLGQCRICRGDVLAIPLPS
ncbi:hypothetical protein ACSBR1_024841 [Camellia fascicularis]